MANFITLSAKLTADAAEFNRQLGAARRSVEDLGRIIDRQNAGDRALADKAAGLRRQGEAYTSVGGAITRYVTLPLALAGGAAIKMGADIETGLSRLVGLANVPAGEIDGIRAALEGVSKTTATSLGELVKGMYTVASVGFRGAEGIDLVTRSAKASAAGLGEVNVIAKLAASVVNAYGRENISAAQAIDSLTAAVTVGGAEATELGATLGDALSAAKAAGVSFQDLAAGVAALTAAGADTNQAVTGIRNVFSQLIDAAPEARKQLKTLGLDIDSLKQTITSKGLLEGLFMLKDAIGGDAEAFAKIFPDIRGLVQVLNLLGQSPQAAIDAFDEVRDSTGALDKAFTAFKETGAAKLKQALVDSQAQFIKLGETLIPLAADVLPKIVGAFRAVVNTFNALPGPLQTGVIALAAIAALSGPVLTLVGNLKRLHAGAIEIGRSMSTAQGRTDLFAKALRGITLTGAMIAVGAFFDRLAFNSRQASGAVGRVTAAAGSDIKDQIAALREFIREQEDIKSKGVNVGIGPVNFFSSNEARKAADAIKAAEKEIRNLKAQLKGAEVDAKKAGDAFTDLGNGANDGAAGIEALSDALDVLDKKAAFADALDALNEVAKVDPFAIAARSAISLRQAQLDLLDAQDRYNELLNRNVGLEQQRVALEARRAAATLASSRVRADQAKADLQRAIDTGQSPLRIAEAQAALGEALVSVDEAQAGLNEAQTAGASAARDLERASLDVQSAQLAVKEAQSQLVTVSEATSQKQKDLEAAFRDLVRLGSDPAVISADNLRLKLIELRDVFPTLAGPINDVLGIIAGAKAAAAAVPTNTNNGIYEPFRTTAPGAVRPPFDPNAFNAPNTVEAGGATVPSIIINVETNASPEQIGEAVDAVLRKRNNRSFI